MPGRARTALLGACILLALLGLNWLAAFHIGLTARADRQILLGFTGIGHHPRVSSVANSIAGLCDPQPYVFFCAVPVIVALLRRRLWIALAVLAILLGANVTTQLLKPLLDTPHPYPVPYLGAMAGSWPSGHATAGMSLALCCVLAAPARLRPLIAAVGAAFAVAVCYSFLSLEWHYPSDVFGGFLVASIWTLIGIAAVLFARSRRVPGSDPDLATRPTVFEALGPPSAVLLGAVALALVVAVARPHAVASYATLHKTFVIGAAVIAVAGMALATGVMLALRR